MRHDYTLHCTPRPPSLGPVAPVVAPPPAAVRTEPLAGWQAALLWPIGTVLLSVMTDLVWTAAALIVGLALLLAMRQADA